MRASGEADQKRRLRAQIDEERRAARRKVDIEKRLWDEKLREAQRAKRKEEAAATSKKNREAGELRREQRSLGRDFASRSTSNIAGIARGAAGVVTDGFVRDVRAIRAVKFPVFHGGIAPLDSKGRGKVADIDVPIECAGVRIEPGDLVFGDVDGVVVVPRHVEDEVLSRAFHKVASENRTRDDLLQGAKLGEVFDRYGVL